MSTCAMPGTEERLESDWKTPMNLQTYLLVFGPHDHAKLFKMPANRKPQTKLST